MGLEVNGEILYTSVLDGVTFGGDISSVTTHELGEYAFSSYWGKEAGKHNWEYKTMKPSTHWRTAKGEWIEYSVMTDDHLRNTMLMLQRQLGKHWPYLVQESIKRNIKGVGLLPVKKNTNLTDIEGIGPARAEALGYYNIFTYDDFMTTSADSIKKALEISLEEVHQLWENAKKHKV